MPPSGFPPTIETGPEHRPGVRTDARDPARPGAAAAWPFDPAWRPTRPDRLPDGRAWPQVRVISLGPHEPVDRAVAIASVEGQDYPEARHVAIEPGETGQAVLRAIVEDPAVGHLLFLRAGDRLAPGALTALGLDASLSGADAVAGLRILAEDGVILSLDCLGGPDGSLDPAIADRAVDDVGFAPFTGGEILFARTAIARAAFDAGAARPVSELWRRLARSGARLARIGRPVLLQRDPGGRDRPAASANLVVASLTDDDYRGGAGIAHRRLAEALALAGHRVGHLRLADEASPAAAEWTDRFPRVEALAAVGDLVLAGNLHGATRSTAILGRLAARVPVAAVTHDLFALTGRCAHPKDCSVIATGCDARCPTSTEYPQLAPDRIARVCTEKQAVLAAPAAPLLLANSDWTAARARALAPPGARVARIGLAFPGGVFRPGDRAALRRKLGLPPDDVLVVFSAVIADAPDKGFADLVETVRAVARPGIGFVALGRLDDPGAFGPADLHAPGPIGDEASLAEWYGACDICLTASRLETLGQTPVEAGLCGVPSVAYRATGLTCAVLDGVTGLLVEPRPGALAEALSALIDDAPRRRRLGAFAAIALESRYSHAAAALSLHDALSAWGALPVLGSPSRVAFTPDMLRRFAFAADRDPGARGTVARASHPLVRALRRGKHAVLGRGLPLWLRRTLYLASRVRQGLRTGRGGRA